MHIYLVGGAVRDKLLGLEAHDKDYVVTGTTPDELIAQGFTQVGRDFPVFLHPTTHEEYALARTERKSGSGYTGFVCAFGPEVTLEEDLKRRDLTVNAMALDEHGQLIDPWGGLPDLKARLLRHVSPAFVEDPLRVLRAARFAAQLSPFNFTLHPSTAALLRTMAASGELQELTPERCFMEMHKALASADPARFFTILHNCNALDAVLPEIDALFAQSSAFKPQQSAFACASSALAALIAQKTASTPALRFALLSIEMPAAALQNLNARLHLPHEYTDAAMLVQRMLPQCLQLDVCSAADILQLFNELDLFRRPQRLPLLLQGMQAVWQVLGYNAAALHDELTRCFTAAQEVQAQEFVQAGLKGKAIKDALQARRSKVIANSRTALQ